LPNNINNILFNGDSILRSLIISYIFSSILFILFEQINIHIHHNECGSQNYNMRESTMRHLFSLDQEFYDNTNSSSIRGKMRFDTINNQITWNIP